MKNLNQKKKKSILFRMAAMIMTVFTLAIAMALPVSASAAEAPAAVSVSAEASPASPTMRTSPLKPDNTAFVQTAVRFTPQILPLAAGAGNSSGGGASLDTQKDGDSQFTSVVNFFVKWIKRVGLLVAFVGGVMFALAIKNNDAEQKQAGLLTMVAGFVVSALCQAIDMFGIFD